MPNVILILRDDGPAQTLIVINLGDSTATQTLSEAQIKGASLDAAWVDLLGDGKPVDPHHIEVAPFEVRLFVTPRP